MELTERVIEAVRAHPGLTLYRLAILLDVEEHKLARLLHDLAGEKRLRSEVQRMSVRWYLPGVPTRQKPLGGTVTPGTRAWEALVVAAKSKGSITPTDVAAGTRMSLAYAYKVMRRIEAGTGKALRRGAQMDGERKGSSATDPRPSGMTSGACSTDPVWGQNVRVRPLRISTKKVFHKEVVGV